MRLLPDATAMIATRTGIEALSSEPWLTEVRATPAFCTTSTTPKPAAPQPRIDGVNAARSRRRAGNASSSAATRNRTAASQPGPSQSKATLVIGTVVPHSTPAVVRASRAKIRVLRMP